MFLGVLANLYLHYVLDQWVIEWLKKFAWGDVIIVRYADFVIGFERRKGAEQFLEQRRERLREFGLELHPEKTRLIQFGRFAIERRRRNGEGKPGTPSRNLPFVKQDASRSDLRQHQKTVSTWPNHPNRESEAAPDSCLDFSPAKRPGSPPERQVAERTRSLISAGRPGCLPHLALGLAEGHAGEADYAALVDVPLLVAQ